MKQAKRLTRAEKVEKFGKVAAPASKYGAKVQAERKLIKVSHVG